MYAFRKLHSSFRHPNNGVTLLEFDCSQQRRRILEFAGLKAVNLQR